MSVYVSSGGSGTLVTAGAGAHGISVELTLFTTPAVANTIYLISWQVFHDENIVETTNTVEQSPVSGHMKVGSDVAVVIKVANQSDVAESFAISYQYVGIVIDTA